ncbi:hypothetical protein DPEC_G00163550 [Dallia pectoralis]|uniref:Uncharacterized protein n=1 Tax=Dallia pectoralis TaxID=75939 RepID=A0ACC2GH71_DALPE|nr:hypothetical protein DPEC_G00163550 [Dallia pectoralis]
MLLGDRDILTANVQYGCENRHKGEGLRKQDNDGVCAAAPERRLALRSLSLDYRCCTHCSSERKVDSLILLLVGFTDRDKDHWYFRGPDWREVGTA